TTRRTAIGAIRHGHATASLPRPVIIANYHTALATIGKHRVQVDRNRHRDHKTKTRQPFPNAPAASPPAPPPPRSTFLASPPPKPSPHPPLLTPHLAGPWNRPPPGATTRPPPCPPPSRPILPVASLPPSASEARQHPKPVL